MGTLLLETVVLVTGIAAGVGVGRLALEVLFLAAPEVNSGAAAERRAPAPRNP